MSQLAYKIWGLVDPTFAPADHSTNPEGLNFKTGTHIKPHQVLTMSTGQLDQAMYYCHSDGVNYSDELVKVDFTWIRKAVETEDVRLFKREGLISWALAEPDEDGNVQWGPHTKLTEKFYNPRTAALADQRRRRNIVDLMIAQVGAFGVLSYVQTMLRSLDNELNAYINTNDRKLVEKIATYSGAWLEVDASPHLGLPDGTLTLRDAINGSLNYVD